MYIKEYVLIYENLNYIKINYNKILVIKNFII